jgi:DNA-binding NarL/FixJ family response regulator
VEQELPLAGKCAGARKNGRAPDGPDFRSHVAPYSVTRERAMKVLIVESHPLVAEAMGNFVKSWDADLQPHVCASADAVLARLSEPGGEWFRIFLDLVVPGAYGLSLARQVHRAGLHSRCCIVTALDRPEVVAQARAKGFLGYVVKPSSFAAFANALSLALAGETRFPAIGDGVQQAGSHLTRRQERLLDGVRRGLSSKQIAANCFLSEGSVNNCINSALRALNVTNRSHAVAKAIELGLLGLSNIPDGV